MSALALACQTGFTSVAVAQQLPAGEPVQRLLSPLNEQAEAPQAASLTEENYLLQPGDELTVIDPSMSTEEGPYTTVVPVLPDGTISVYPIGTITARGKSIKQLMDEVRARAAEFIVNPQIVLQLSRLRPVEVYVLGNVINPGLYSVEVDRLGRERAQALSMTSGPTIPLPGRLTGGPLTLLAGSNAPLRAYPPASLTVLTAIQMAGGVREAADVRHILVRRRGMPTKVVDLWAMIAEGEAEQDFPLRAGDIIVVPRGGPAFDAELLGAAANRKRAVRIFGAIRAPGIYELTPRDDLISIISRAGGFTDTAIKSHVYLSRQDPAGKITTLKASIKRTVRDEKAPGRLPVMPGDVVEVKDSVIKRTAPVALTIAGTFLSAFFILYFSRVIVDRSQPTVVTTTTTTTAASGNTAPTATASGTAGTTQ